MQKLNAAQHKIEAEGLQSKDIVGTEMGSNFGLLSFGTKNSSENLDSYMNSDINKNGITVTDKTRIANGNIPGKPDSGSRTNGAVGRNNNSEKLGSNCRVTAIPNDANSLASSTSIGGYHDPEWNFVEEVTPNRAAEKDQNCLDNGYYQLPDFTKKLSEVDSVLNDASPTDSEAGVAFLNTPQISLQTSKSSEIGKIEPKDCAIKDITGDCESGEEPGGKNREKTVAIKDGNRNKCLTRSSRRKSSSFTSINSTFHSDRYSFDRFNLNYIAGEQPVTVVVSESESSECVNYPTVLVNNMPPYSIPSSQTPSPTPARAKKEESKFRRAFESDTQEPNSSDDELINRNGAFSAAALLSEPETLFSDEEESALLSSTSPVLSDEEALITGEESGPDVFGQSSGDDSITSTTIWKNQAFEICSRRIGQENLDKRLEKLSKVKPAGFASRTRLSLQANKAKKTVASPNSYIRRCNCVGAVGYAVVLDDERLPENDFFRPDIRFRIRLRHSNVRCADDAASSPREAAIKFADQNEDGPLDLIMTTGRTSLARSCNNLLRTMKLTSPDQIRDQCFRNPYFYFSLVDSLRRAPSSYAELTYHSQISYLFITKDGHTLLARFRLVPGQPDTSTVDESGLLGEEEQLKPWVTARKPGETRPKCYLRQEFMKRMEGFDAIRYLLQIQLAPSDDESMWNPQLIWDEEDYPWIDLLRIQLTTTIPLMALCKTYFNIVDKPACLRFIKPSSVHDFKSYQYACAGMYTRFEIDHMQVKAWKGDELLQKELTRRGKIQYYISLCTASVRDTKPRVDVFVTLIGTRGRTAPQRLDHRLEEEEDEMIPPGEEGTEHFLIQTLPIGELLAISISVRHRHLTDEWYLRYVVLSDTERLRVRHFPCNTVVLSKATLRPGEVSLPHKDCHELLRQERMLELRDRQSDYLWSLEEVSSSMPGRIAASTSRDLPVNEQIECGKFTGMPWDVDPTTIETLLPFLANAAARGLLPSIPLFHRQTASMGDNLPAMGPVRRAMPRAQKPGGLPISESSARARKRWRKIRFAIAFICKPKIPDGPKGEMCRSVEDDVDFGRMYIMGTNPVILRRINRLPENLPVSDRTFEGYLNRGGDLEEELRAGHIYIADYKVLQDIPCIHRDADRRYLVAPIVLFFVREFGDLIPLCIQLGQDPGPDNPIWTPRDSPEEWILAKLWVRCADFHYHFAITHLLKTHFVAEPFAMATIRRLSSSHPVYKLLKPHFRYIFVTNTLLRRHILRENCAIDKYTSIGAAGFRRLMNKYMREYFTFDELHVTKDLAGRGVDDPELLPNYFYRDDALALWDSIYRYAGNTLRLFYTNNEDVEKDTELQEWIEEINNVGFGCLSEDDRLARGLPASLVSVDEVTTLTTMIIFTVTCQHSATHTEALDLYGYIPKVPAMMRQPPMTTKNSVNKEVITRTLPDQFPDAYYGSLASLLQVHRPDENTLGDSSEIYFVEPEARRIADLFHHHLDLIHSRSRDRNKATSIMYENLVPSWIPNSVEPLPFLPRLAKQEALKGTSKSDPSTESHVFIMTPSVPMNILPMCMFLARNLGGKGGARGGRVATSKGATVAMEGVGIPKDSKKAGKQKFSDMF